MIEMKIYSVYDKEFNEYGRVLSFDFTQILTALKRKECPDNTIYVPSDGDLECCSVTDMVKDEVFGGLPVQAGYCNGHNQLLNCLEYHKSSEVNITEGDMILLLGKLQDVEKGVYNTENVMAFTVPAGCGVELYSTSMHYAPCGVNGSGFRVAVILPKGTNYGKPAEANDPLLWGSNKWLIAHKDAPEAKQGAFVGLIGDNIKV